LMESSAAILEKPRSTWEAPVEYAVPDLTILKRPDFAEEISQPPAGVIPTPTRIKVRTILSILGPPIVFALAVAGIVWFWPPF
jgi:hypothetical protein